MRPDDLEGFGPVGSNGPANLLPRLHDAALGREDTVIGRLLSEAAAEIERLRAEVKSLQTLRDVVIENHGYWKDRAERLAEALRDALECGNDGDWQSARQYITAALRDYDQEVGNGWPD